jgi:WXG100 family type VII secretion target
MGGKVGGDIEQMRTLARMFNTNAGKLDTIIKDLNSRTVDSDSIWSGPAANRFRGEWDQARATFEKMVQALEEAGAAVRQSAQQIERATQ